MVRLSWYPETKKTEEQEKIYKDLREALPACLGNPTLFT
jgi:hypothetical protein